ncbi:Thioredoxin domain-containing protein 2 [Branchiostoma belcheri]|nr:Thioredoxin domain-containing protein 2 [Branchiostoma belcheri]
MQEAFTDFMKRNEDKLTVVNFYAAWLGPCKMIAPVFEEMAATIPGVACGKVDVDESDVDTMVGANADKLRALIYRMTMVNDNMNASEQGRLVSSYHSTLRKTAYLCGTV